MPHRAVAISFDDGYRDNLSLALPVLQRWNIPATFFLVPGLLDRRIDAWWEVLGWAFARGRSPSVEWEGRRMSLTSTADRQKHFNSVAQELKTVDDDTRTAAVEELAARLDPVGERPNGELFLDWEDARALVRGGHAIGSHSDRHQILSQETPEAQSRALGTSRVRLQQELDVDVRLLAYPNGRRQDYDASTLGAVAGAGYSFACTTVDGWNDRSTPPFEIRRTVIYPERGLVGLGSILRPLVPAGTR